MAGSGVMAIFFYKWLTKNPEIGNTLVWFLPSIWGLGQVRDSKFGTNVSNEKLLNAAKCQGYSFCRFWVIKGKPTEGVYPLHTHKLGLINTELAEIASSQLGEPNAQCKIKEIIANDHLQIHLF